MKVKKRMTPRALQANRDNSYHSTGPTTERGKDIVSQNAFKEGIFSHKFHFKSGRERRGYAKLVGELKDTVDWDNPVERVFAEEFAASTLRRARFLNLEERLYQRHNPATELVIKTIQNSEALNAGFLLPDSKAGWECNEIKIVGKKASDAASKKGPVAVDAGNNVQFELHAKFADPINKVLKYNRATSRDLYRSAGMIEKSRRKRQGG